MKVVLATPLYPPEIAEPAPYVKELAKRLAKLHDVTIVTYSRLPEKVPGVSIIVVGKHKPLFLRLITYFFAFLRATWRADIIYAMNGASVELPVALATIIMGRPLVFHIGDTNAHEHARHNLLLRTIERFAFSRAKKVVTDKPATRPEIFPLETFPAESMMAYERSWETHLRLLDDIFNYAS